MVGVHHSVFSRNKHVSVKGTDFSKRDGGKAESGFCLQKARRGWGPMSMNPWATSNSIGSDERPAISLHVNLSLAQPVPLST